MTVVALVGPDGAGKTTVARRLVQRSRTHASYLYMGVNADAFEDALPTTRLVMRRKERRGARPALRLPATSLAAAGRARRVAVAAKTAAARANWAAEAAARRLRARRLEGRGVLVVTDRDFRTDFSAEVAGQPMSLGARMFGGVLQAVAIRPDVLVVLDVPAPVAFGRKGEADVTWLDGRRSAYRRTAARHPCALILDATQPVDVLVQAIADELAVPLEGTTPAPSPFDHEVVTT